MIQTRVESGPSSGCVHLRMQECVYRPRDRTFLVLGRLCQGYGVHLPPREPLDVGPGIPKQNPTGAVAIDQLVHELVGMLNIFRFDLFPEQFSQPCNSRCG